MPCWTILWIVLGSLAVSSIPRSAHVSNSDRFVMPVAEAALEVSSRGKTPMSMLSMYVVTPSRWWNYTAALDVMKGVTDRQVGNSSLGTGITAVKVSSSSPSLGRSFVISKPQEEEVIGVALKSGRVQPEFDVLCSSHDTKTECFKYTTQADRIFIEMHFAPTEDYYKFGRPQIVDSTLPEREFPITVSDFRLEEASGYGGISLYVSCPKHQEKESSVFFTMEMGMRGTVDGLKLRFHKACGTGRNPNIHVGIFNEANELDLMEASSSANDGGDMEASDNIISDQDRRTRWISPRTNSLQLGIIHTDHLGAQAYGPLVVTSSETDITVRVEPYTTGLVRHEFQSRAVLHFDCHSKASGFIRVTIPIPPFESLQLRMVKNCGSLAPRSLSIGTGEFGSREIAENGVFNPDFIVDKGDVGRLFSLDDNAGNYFDMVFTNTDAMEPLTFDSAHVELSNSSVLFATLPSFASPSSSSSSSPSSASSLLLFSDNLHQSETLAPLTAKRLRLRMICKHQGSSIITIRLLLTFYNPIEISLARWCRSPSIHHSSDASSLLFRAAASLIYYGMVLSPFVLLLSSLLYYYYHYYYYHFYPSSDQHRDGNMSGNMNGNMSGNMNGNMSGNMNGNMNGNKRSISGGRTMSLVGP